MFEATDTLPGLWVSLCLILVEPWLVGSVIHSEALNDSFRLLRRAGPFVSLAAARCQQLFRASEAMFRQEFWWSRSQ